jgi:hypothetical protein
MTHLTSIALAISFGLAANVALAQSTDTPQNPPAQDQQNHSDLTSMKNNGHPTTDSAPEKTRMIQNQDASTGNDQIPQKKGAEPADLTSMKNQGKSSTDSAPMKTEMIKKGDTTTGNDQMGHRKGVHTDFAELDGSHSGYVTKADAKNDKWLKRHFKRCDSNKDGRISQPEYTTCTTGQR